MKGKTARYILAALAGAAVLLGCTRTEPETVGAASLTARIAEEVPATRTSYDGYEGKFLWDEGDEIAVHIADGTAAGRYETFKVLPNDPAETASVPISTTSSMSRNGYAVYPASAAVAASYGSPTLKVSLPAEYDISDIVSGASSIKTSDFSPCPMVAINDPAVAPDELDFHHVGGLLRIPRRFRRGAQDHDTRREWPRQGRDLHTRRLLPRCDPGGREHRPERPRPLRHVQQRDG